MAMDGESDDMASQMAEEEREREALESETYYIPTPQAIAAQWEDYLKRVREIESEYGGLHSDKYVYGVIEERLGKCKPKYYLNGSEIRETR